MADLQEDFENHRIHSGLREAREKAEIARGLLADDADPGLVERAEAIIEAVRWATLEIAALDGRLVRLSELEIASDNLDGIINNVSAVEGDIVAGLDAAHDHAVALLEQLESLPIVRSETPSDIARQSLELVEQDLAVRRRDLEQLQQAVSASVGQSEVLVEELSSRLAEHSEALDLAKADLERESASFAQKADDAAAAVAAVATEVNDVRVAHDENNQAAVADYQAWETAAQGRIEAHLESIQKLNDQAAEMLRNAGGAALGTSWKAGAQRHLIERGLWTVMIGVILGGSIWVAAEHLDELTAPAGSSFVEGLVFYLPRVPFAIITITTLGFAIQQASRRGQYEARDGRVGNELSSLPSFLARLPEGSRDELARQIATNYFPGTKLENDVPPAPATREPATTFGLSHTALAGIASNAVLAIVALYALTR